MGKIYPELDERLTAFIAEQPVFFVGTAPSGPSGHINVSPKGYADTFTVLGPRRVAYQDLTGSGAETMAHLRDNGRITIMFCAFTGPPKILRLYGSGRVVPLTDPEFDALTAAFPGRHPGTRAVVVVDVERVADSCGYAVPELALVGERDILDRANGRKSDQDLRHYRATKNATSIDSLPAFDPSPRAAAR
jgi:Pyridoxamine 5'-phosphate oxidase